MFRTLLVDDNDLFRESLRAVLYRNFPTMEVDQAVDGATALGYLGNPQLVFMDIRLPDINGLELTRRFKARQPGLLVCVVTQFDIPEYRDAANQSGASEFFFKDSLTDAVVVGLVDSILAAQARVPLRIP
ncbi:MAG: response regulator transcription factor [Propionivibrio sp.]